MAVTTGLATNSCTSQPIPSNPTTTDSNGLYSSHSPGRSRGGSFGVALFESTTNSLAVRAWAWLGAVSQHTMSEATIRQASNTCDCHRKIVCENGNTPVMANSPGGMLAGLACNWAADELRPSAHTAPRPRYAAAPAAL